jgi:acyl-CoA thioesterase-1
MGVLIEDNAKVLFIGDSITDDGRRQIKNKPMGAGYAYIAASWFEALYPEKHVEFINRGIGGNRIQDLRGRWQEDCLDLKPSWVSILIGVNHAIWGYLRGDPMPAEEFKGIYRDLLTQVKEDLGARIILCEPFLIPATEERLGWRPDLTGKIEATRELALEFGALLIPFDGMFAQACARREPAFWAMDSVHPTGPGHALMAKAWLEAVGAI